MRITTTAACEECGRVFNLEDDTDAAEWSYGHDCEDGVLEDDGNLEAWYMRHGNLAVPASRYAHNTRDAAVVAVVATRIVGRETGEPTTVDAAEHLMGCVVNNHDDIAYLFEHYATGEERERVDAASWEYDTEDDTDE